MHRLIRTIILTGLTLAATQSMAAAKNSDELMFEKIFSTWTNAFDHKDLAGTCSIFSKNVIANYQGHVTLKYQTLCSRFKKIFQEPRDYQYTFKINQVHRANNLAAVRVTWHLRISEHGKYIAEAQDEGLDVFRKDAQGNWKIINYLGYPVYTKSSQQK